MQKRVERYLKKSRHLRVISRESNALHDRTEYSLRLRWSLLGMLLFNKVIRLSVIKVDHSVTRLELRFTGKNQLSDGNFSFRPADRVLNKILLVF